jgi:hypothetical protein
MQLNEQITKLNNEDKTLSSRIQKEQIELGKLTQEEKSYQETLKKRFEALKTISKELGIGNLFILPDIIKTSFCATDFSVDSPEDKKGTDKAFISLEKAVLDFETDLKKTVTEQDQVEKALENEIYKCR